MPIVAIKDCGGGPPKSGIPVRLPPQNICDVNPYVCRMTPASIDFKSDPPFVGKLSFEPHPRGCQCCAKVLEKERESYRRSGTTGRCSQASSPRESLLYQSCYPTARRDPHERHLREPSVTTQMSPRSFREGPPEHGKASLPRAQSKFSQQPEVPPTQSRTSAQTVPDRRSTQPTLTKKQRKMQMKNEKKQAKLQWERDQRLFKQLKKKCEAARRAEDREQVRLLREQTRRDDFVTACCTGLLRTPCVSAGSCSEEADEREQANFYVQCKCCPAPNNNPCATNNNPCTTHNNPCANDVRTRKSKRQADFPCQCRNCKYQDTGCRNRRTGCLEEPVGESPVCYCTDEEKAETRPHRVCDEEPNLRGARAGQRGFYPQGDGTVCDEMMPTGATLLTCEKQEGDGACTKMVTTAELMQDMLIKQAQQGIQLANSLLTNKKFQLVDVTVPGSQNIPPGQIEGYRTQLIQMNRTEQKSQYMQTSGSSRSNQPVELYNSNLKCYLKNVDPPDAVLPAGSETGQTRYVEPLPRPPLNPYPTETNQDEYFKMNAMGEAQYQSPLYQQPEDTTRTSSYQGSIGSAKPILGSNSKMKRMGEYPPAPPFRQPEGTAQAGQGSYQGSIGLTGQTTGARTGITGHICIRRDALLQDPMNPKLCIPLSFDPCLSMGSANCPFKSDHAQAEGSMLPEPGFAARTGSQRTQKLAQGSNQSLTRGSHHSLQKEGSQQGIKPGLHNGLQQQGSKQGLAEGSQKCIQKQDSRQLLQKESSITGQQDPRRQVQDKSGRNLQEVSSRRTETSSKQRDSDRDRRRRDSDRERGRRDLDLERRGRDPGCERRRRESESPERSRIRSKRHETEQRPYRGHNDKPKPDPTTNQRRKRSISPCTDSDRTYKKGDATGKRRPSPSEMVRTLNGYETDLLQAMDKVKGKYMKKRGNETSSSRGSSFDSMTPGLAEFNCLLKHITCLRKELNKYSKDTTD